MKRRIAAFLAFVLVLSTCMTAMAASYSVNWKQAADGNWQAFNNGVLLKNTWILDDQCDVAGGLYYLVDENGNLVSSQLIKDGEGRYYTFNDQHDGHFGAMRTANGKYQGVNLTFSAVHDGSFGSITNADGIKALAAKVGVKEMPNIKNASMVKMSELNKVASSTSGGSQEYTVYYNVSFDVNLGSATPSEYETQKIKSGSKVVKPASPSDVNREENFLGWTTTFDGVECWDFDKPVTQSMTLFAMWDKIPSDYLTFRAEADDSSVTFNYKSGSDVQYRADGENWADYTKGTKVTLAKTGDMVQFRGKNVATNYDNHFSMTGKIAASGSVTSLTDFYGADPEVELSNSCYLSMFSGCTALTTAPELPAATLANYCYQVMFKGCTGLTTAPELPAETLGERCYVSMFNGCTGLTAAPELPATTLTGGCYVSMFNGCTALTAAPELPAATLTGSCYAQMFQGCISLTKAPELPAETATTCCYSYMFDGCTNLTKAPARLPAGTLALRCCEYMFQNCTSLEQAPELPATTMAEQCYFSMFRGCSKLKKAPKLPATTLAKQCYGNMFSKCKALSVKTTGTEDKKIFECPAAGSFPANAVDSMFNETKGGSITPVAGTTYYNE